MTILALVHRIIAFREQKRRLGPPVIAAVLLFLPIGVIKAQDADSAPDANEQSRTALVIGNANYAVGPLNNPVNDANDVTLALRAARFHVIQIENATKQQMDRGLRQFGDLLSARQGIGLFYFSGHGMQVDGENYLIPVDATLERRDEVKYQTVYAEQVLEKMKNAGNPVNIVILDACRTNPYRAFGRSLTGGLAHISAAKGTLIAYATAPNTVASDGSGRNGLYTKYVLQSMRKPGLPIEMVFKDVIQHVELESEGKQTPWYQSSLSGYFAFIPRKPTILPAPSQSLVATPPSTSPGSDQTAADMQTTTSGVRYIDLRIGGGARPQHGRKVKLHYVGYLPDKSVFHSTYEKIGRAHV